MPAGPDKVVLHPLVLLSVVDHYNRVAKDTKKRVVGVLLGELYKGQIDVTNSFALPFEEDDHDTSIWFLDHSYLEQMYKMFKKVNGEARPRSTSGGSPRSLWRAGEQPWRNPWRNSGRLGPWGGIQATSAGSRACEHSRLQWHSWQYGCWPGRWGWECSWTEPASQPGDGGAAWGSAPGTGLTSRGQLTTARRQSQFGESAAWGGGACVWPMQGAWDCKAGFEAGQWHSRALRAGVGPAVKPPFAPPALSFPTPARLRTNRHTRICTLALATASTPHATHTTTSSRYMAMNPAAREKIVGWYSTGPKLRESDLDINELMRGFCESPVLVICEVQVRRNGGGGGERRRGGGGRGGGGWIWGDGRAGWRRRRAWEEGAEDRGEGGRNVRCAGLWDIARRGSSGEGLSWFVLS